jgi:hypothetical protein
MAKKAINFKSKQKELNWIRAVNSIPSKTQPGKSVAQASPGNTPIRIKNKLVVVKHKKK